MKYEEYAYYSSEISQLERLLSKLPEERSIERMGLRYQLSIAKERIEGVPIPPIPQTAYVTFSGKPVTGHDGIDANFSATAVGLSPTRLPLQPQGMQETLDRRVPFQGKGLDNLSSPEWPSARSVSRWNCQVMDRTVERRGGY